MNMNEGCIGDDDVTFFDVLIRYVDGNTELGYEMVRQAGRDHKGTWQRLARVIVKELEERYPSLCIERFSPQNPSYKKFREGQLPIVSRDTLEKYRL